MKTILIFAILFINSLAQVDTSDWYPLQIGNKWEYWYGIENVSTYTVEIIGDTVMPNGKTYSILKNGTDLDFHRVEGNEYVFEYDRFDSTEYLLYDFVAKDSTFWGNPSWGNQSIFWGIQNTDEDYNYYLNKTTAYKIFNWVEVDSSSTPPDTIWEPIIDVYPTKITKGIGVTSYSFTNVYEGMNGAIINGDTLGVITSVQNEKQLIRSYELLQNYPNPFNPTTNIVFTLPKNDVVELIIYNSLGEQIEVLINKEYEKGFHEIKFNASKYSSGVYFYSLKTKSYFNVKKMLLLK